jgi:glycosyltransferase involved in cell wall biosynthesis
MLCRNEADRYLDMILKNTSKIVDGIVLLDDGSDDNSMEIYAKYPKVEVVRSTNTWTDGENVLRKELNDYIVAKYKPTAILAVDGDDLFCTSYAELHSLLINKQYAWYWFKWFNCIDDLDHYKAPCDIYPSTEAPRMYRVGASNAYYYGDGARCHVTQVPLDYYNLPALHTNIKIKHLGHFTRKDREHHYHNYTTRIDPKNLYGSKETYEKILDENIELFKFDE